MSGTPADYCLVSSAWIVGAIGSVYRWFVRYFQPEVWSAIAAWATLAVAVGAFLYARQQVYEAKQARIRQENQSRAALAQQAELSRQSKCISRPLADQPTVAPRERVSW